MKQVYHWQKRAFLLLSVSVIVILVGAGWLLHPWWVITNSPLVSQLTISSPRFSGSSGQESRFKDLRLIGGFSVGTPAEVAEAAALGMRVVFEYGNPPSPESELGQALQAAHMQVIDGYISSYLQYYECHRTKTVKPPPPGAHPYCGRDSVPIPSEEALLQLVRRHLEETQSNPLILGYWVLDDWVLWDPGSARELLIKFHDLIQQYTPQRPAICGFGASPPSGFDTGWHDEVAANFTPEGCDMIGLYIFTVLQAKEDASASRYDWSMRSTLNAMFTSLQKRGWSYTQTPLIGIAQAFGGPSTRAGLSWPLPSTADIVQQSQSFCQHGATGIAYYGWDANLYSSQTQTPANNRAIQEGIRQGIAACQHIWSTAEQGTPLAMDQVR
ncbi:hypothetical protein KTAU_38630 [Thermogemmatispora aurantia]|jgi:hypothetical protein|uniref:GH26 domain-containing protein n=1 Tax=Thermogemmatispora aurantia TaxID=2045279 RepID=A0A5J4K9F7_9CHLR|nr:hypothetical protein [Thermogemmatispora aurantia]GER85228.1 hypothetical protein KTAU_38630 [Thermogemmatispora aurantia]